MNIGINLLYLLPGKVGGTETYAVRLLEALASLDAPFEYIVYLNRESSDLPLPPDRRMKRVVCPVRATSRLSRYLFEQAVLPLLLWKHRVNLLHSLGYVGPLWSTCRTVVSLPDTNFVDAPESFSTIRRIVLSLFSTLSARRSDHVVTISEFSKRRIHRLLRIPSRKITVTPLGPGWLDSPGSPADGDLLKTRYRLPGKYIAAFGGGARHKNIPRLIQAYLGEARLHDHALVLLGRLPDDVGPLPAAAEGAPGPRVHCLGFVPREHIQPLLARAAAFALPTLYEGFGLPMLEAQYSGTIVASSSAASLPEVGGPGAIYFDPTSVEAIARSLLRAVTLSPGEAEALRTAARENLSRYSWAATAEGTLRVYRALLPR